MSSEKTYLCACVVLSIATLIGIVLFAVSIHTVDYNHIAIVQNKFSKTINTERIYQSGRYMIGVTSK